MQEQKMNPPYVLKSKTHRAILFEKSKKVLNKLTNKKSTCNVKKLNFSILFFYDFYFQEFLKSLSLQNPKA